MNTYSLVSPIGTTEYRGLSLVEAAQAILDDKSLPYELRFDPKYDVAGEHLYELWGTTKSTPKMTSFYDGNGRGIMAYAASEEAAWPSIAEMVIRSKWPGHLEAITDTEYDATVDEAVEV
jgi:hypothetical protein